MHLNCAGAGGLGSHFLAPAYQRAHCSREQAVAFALAGAIVFAYCISCISSIATQDNATEKLVCSRNARP